MTESNRHFEKLGGTAGSDDEGCLEAEMNMELFLGFLVGGEDSQDQGARGACVEGT